MSRAQASKEAAKRWQGGSLLKNDHGAHMVGYWTPGGRWIEKGCGSSWATAFRDADHREAE